MPNPVHLTSDGTDAGTDAHGVDVDSPSVLSAMTFLTAGSGLIGLYCAH
jgi:hypothetical protein